MKRTINIIVIITFIMLLSSCKTTKETYQTFQEQHLSASTAFKQKEKEYYLYFYADKCVHCNNIKEIIFKQAKDEHTPLYFINNKDVKGTLKRTDDIEFSNYGLTSFKDVTIFGFPTLLLLRDKRVIAQFLGSTKISEELE